MHITYANELDRESLQQGDVLLRTPSIDALLAEVHPHYTSEDYRYLMVLTQTCDLVRRLGEEKRCKARYISVAAVRPLERVISREIEKYQRSPLERNHRLCDATHREKVEQFLSRLLNNNAEEFFYLHPHQYAGMQVGMTEGHCAFLALSIAIKSDLHYTTCLDAKILQLNDSFQHKLGWLVGKMYSRVGTPDWVPDVCTEDDFKKTIDSVLDSACVWIEPTVKKQLSRALKKVPPLEQTTDRVLAEYAQVKQDAPKKKDLLVTRLGEILIEQNVDADVVRKVKNRVNSDPDIAEYVSK